MKNLFQTDRCFELLKRMADGEVSVREIAKEANVHERTISRDIKLISRHFTVRCRHHPDTGVIMYRVIDVRFGVQCA